MYRVSKEMKVKLQLIYQNIAKRGLFAPTRW